MDFEQGKKAIAWIYSAAGEVVGVGFLVSERYMLTCAHVVAAAVGSSISDPAKATLDVVFPRFNRNQKYQTKVVFDNLDPDPEVCRNDFAILQLEVLPETGIQYIEFVDFSYTAPVGLRAFGCPEGDTQGRNLTAVTSGSVADGWEQIEPERQTGLAIEEGFSGAPVWCQELEGFVGMVVARDQRKPESKVGFMIPTQQLGKPLQFVRQQTLFDLLQREPVPSEQIRLAYEICRPKDLPKPYQSELSQRLDDLSRMSSGEIGEPMLVQFVACLLNQSLTESVRQDLQNWAERYADKLERLWNQLQNKRNRIDAQKSQSTQKISPGLLVSIKSHESKEKYCYVSAWLIRDFNCYSATTGEGSELLVFGNEGRDAELKGLNPEVGIPHNKIAALLAYYLDQAGQRGIDIQQLTVELLLPLSLMNEPIEQRLLPVEFGIPQALGRDCHVVVRAQERLAADRALGRWQSKWQRLEASLETNAGHRFVPGTDNLRQLQNLLRSDDKLGLQLTRPPSLDDRGELGILIATGTPIALWVRQNDSSVDWGQQFAHQVFGCLDSSSGNSDYQAVCCLHSDCQFISSDRLEGQEHSCQSIRLEELPDRIAKLRQKASDIEDGNLAQSLELGHHLSFVWDNPKRVPPKMDYSLRSL